MRRPRRPGFTLFQLLVLLALLALLFGLFVTSIAKARFQAEQARATNNLKILALALHNYNDTYGMLPPGIDDNHFSATAKLLPYIEQDNLFKQIDLKKSIDDKANAEVRKVQVKDLLSPNDPIKAVKPEYGATNYLFNDLVFSLNSKARIPASFPDGTSNTIVIGETLKGDGKTNAVDVKRQHVVLKKEALAGINDEAGIADFKDNKNIAGDRCSSWMDGRFLQGTFNGARRPNDVRPDVSCEGAGGLSALRSLGDTVFVALADGSTRSVNAKKISHETWKAAITPNGGEVLGADWSQ
jgi:type II secretory pathway pseudopilin PulG